MTHGSSLCFSEPTELYQADLQFDHMQCHPCATLFFFFSHWHLADSQVWLLSPAFPVLKPALWWQLPVLWRWASSICSEMVEGSLSSVLNSVGNVFKPQNVFHFSKCTKMLNTTGESLMWTNVINAANTGKSFARMILNSRGANNLASTLWESFYPKRSERWR